MDINIRNILDSLKSDLVEPTAHVALSAEENNVKENIKDILQGYLDGATVVEHELIEDEAMTGK